MNEEHTAGNTRSDRRVDEAEAEERATLLKDSNRKTNKRLLHGVERP